MKWMNHAIVTGTLVYGFTGGKVFLALVAVAGSLFPDRIEGKAPEEEEKLNTWRGLHRAASHWFLPYAVVAGTLLVCAVSQREGDIVSGRVLSLVGAFFLGSLFHIGEDALCGRVPSLNPAKKIGTRFFAVGSVEEYLFCFSLAALLVLGMVFL